MEKEVKLIDIQLLATYAFIFSLIISLMLTYNDKYKTLYGKGFLTKKQNYKISVFNRILIVILSFTFLYINKNSKDIAKQKGNNIEPFKLQIAASELSLIAALIVTYVVITSGEYSIITSSENPAL